MTKISNLLKKIYENSILKYNAWRQPTTAELENEWQSEYWFSNLAGVPEINRKLVDKYKDIILQNLMKFTTIEDMEYSKNLNIYHYDSIEDLKKYIKHMGKNIDSMVKAYTNNEPLPYPLFMRGKDLTNTKDSYVILGGRTRVSVAKILNVDNIKVLVIDQNKLNSFLRPYWISDFKNSETLYRGLILLQPDEYKDLFDSYVLGKLKVFPEPLEPTKLRDQIKNNADKLRIKFGTD